MTERFRRARQQKIENFMHQYGEQFLADFPVMTQQEILTKYQIAYSFYIVLRDELHLEQDREYLAEVKSQRLSNAMHHGGTEKAKATTLERYGVDSYWKVPGVQKRISQLGNAPEAREKAKQTNLAKFGVITPLNLPENRAKSVAAAHTPEVLAKSRQTRIDRFGVPYCLPAVEASRTPEVQLKREATMLERYGTKFVHNPKKAQQTMLERYGVNCSYFVNESSPARISKINRQFAQRLADAGIAYELDKRVCGTHPFDIVVGKYLIEINPSVSHSFMFSFTQLTGYGKDIKISEDYHYEHWLAAKQNGYEQLSLFDWMNEDKFFDLLLSKLGVSQTKIGARKFTVELISKTVANKFLDANHVLGSCKGNDINLALVLNGEPYAVMTFGTPRYNKSYDYELLRFATLKGYSIAGGASKLFKHFIAEHEGTIITYSDNNLGNGSVYSLLGFREVEQRSRTLVWVSVRTGHSFRHVSLVAPPPNGQGADRLIGGYLKDKYFFVGTDREDFIRRGGKEEYAEEFEAHKDEPDWWPGNVDIAIHNHYVPVVDCGSTIWSYSN